MKGNQELDNPQLSDSKPFVDSILGRVLQLRFFQVLHCQSRCIIRRRYLKKRGRVLLGVSTNEGSPKWMVYNRQSYENG
jgi:hypothetical protein